ncbi:MAG: lamin tail domain-containing protein [Anaerolineae bacterium]
MKKPFAVALAVFVAGLIFIGGWVRATSSAHAQGPATVLINEVAWAGTDASTADEWIELFNVTDGAIDLTGWTLQAGDGGPSLTLVGQIPANGYYLIERTDDNTVSDIVADLFASFGNGLANGGEVLTLRNSSNVVVDTANGNGGGWPGGEIGSGYPPYASMERCSSNPDTDGNWTSNNGSTVNGLDANSNPLNATPKAKNSIAPPDGVASAQVGNFTVVLLGYENLPDGTSTWTYSLSSDCETGQNSPALSHWDLELCDAALGNVNSQVGVGAYQTIGSYTSPQTSQTYYGTSGITYDVVLGPDGSGLPITGIKYENGEVGLGEFGAETHIFQFTLNGHYALTPVDVGTKAGQQLFTGVIPGPACATTAITLASFSAAVEGEDVTLAWQTGTEIDNAGFNLYRAASANGPWTKINSALIAAQGDPVAGAGYTFADRPGSGLFYYTLEDVDFNGQATRHGPLRAAVGPALRRPLHRPSLPVY